MEPLGYPHAALAVMEVIERRHRRQLAFTVEARRTASPPASTTTFSAGLRSQLVKFPSSSSPISAHS
jgi:hypothetical protein